MNDLCKVTRVGGCFNAILNGVDRTNPTDIVLLPILAQMLEEQNFIHRITGRIEFEQRPINLLV